MILKIFLLTLCVAYTRSQVSYGTLSSSAFRETSTQQTSTTSKVSFGTLSSSAFRTTTTSPAIECPAEVKPICKNGGQCNMVNNEFFRCVCAEGFIGIDCSTQVTTLTTTPSTTITLTTGTTTTPLLVKCPNDLNICKNDGECNIVNNSDIRCKCKDGFTGVFCEITIIVPFTTPAPRLNCPLSIDLCQNDAKCFLIENDKVICECKTGFTGLFCETNVFPTTTVSTGIMSTQALFTTTPSVEICPNSLNFCKNDGGCLVINGNTILCQCRPGFTGFSCENEIESTTTAPSVVVCPPVLNICKNDGECSFVNNNDIKCTCKNDFTGKFCEIGSSEPAFTTTVQTTTTQSTTTTSWSGCPINVCSNGGTCGVLNGKEIICTCAAGFTGPLCQFSF